MYPSTHLLKAHFLVDVEQNVRGCKLDVKIHPHNPDT